MPRPPLRALALLPLLAACATRPPALTEPSPATASAGPGIPAADRVRIAEAFRLSERLGERVWPGWRGVPFAVLLVTADREYLVRHPRPSADFTRLGHDPLLGGEVFVRRRVFPPTLQATFPAVGGVATVVIGDAEHTGLRSTAWVLTLPACMLLAGALFWLGLLVAG